MRSHVRAPARIGIVLAVVSAAGCASSTKQANRLDQEIHARTSQIVKASTTARQHVASADRSIRTAATHPSNPPQTKALLSDASKELTSAGEQLDTIAPAAKTIDETSTRAAALTAGVEKKLIAERDHWLGYKLRVTLWAIGLLAVPAAVIVFIVKTNGGGPLLGALGEILGDVLRGFWIYLLKPVGTCAFHLFTLGASFAAEKVNRHYDLGAGSVEIHDVVPKK